MKAYTLATALLLLCPSSVWGQAPSTPLPAEPVWQIEPYLGVARHSPGGTHLGTIEGRNHLFVGIHITGTILQWERLVLAYAPEVVPLLVVSDNPTYHTDSRSDPYPVLRVADGKKAVAGIGGSPIGFEGRVSLASRLRVYAATAAGMVVFTRATPLPNARSFNFTFEVGAGGDYLVRPGWWLRVGYKFHHLSNGNSAPENPGVDAKVVMVGLGHRIGKS